MHGTHARAARFLVSSRGAWCWCLLCARATSLGVVTVLIFHLIVGYVIRHRFEVLARRSATPVVVPLNTRISSVSVSSSLCSILIDHARVEAQQYKFTYDEDIPTESICKSICDIALRFGEDRNEIQLSRPFGVALLIGGVDETGPALYQTDPSGTYVQYLARAVGSGHEQAQQKLEEEYYKSMTLKEAEVLILTILRQVMKEKMTFKNVQLAKITVKDKKWEVVDEKIIESLIDNLEPLEGEEEEEEEETDSEGDEELIEGAE